MIGWEAFLGGTEVDNAGALSMSLSLSELTTHVCGMDSVGHWDPPIPRIQDLWKDSLTQMLSQGLPRIRLIPA